MSSPLSFTQKILRITITLADGVSEFAPGQNTLILTGARAMASIRKDPPPAKNVCTCKIFGMSAAHMNAATVVPNQASALKFPASKKVYLMVEAGDLNGFSTVFQGEITEAWASYQTPPNMYFHIEALTGYYLAQLPVPPVSYQGGVDVDTILRSITATMGYGYVNNGLSWMLNNPYLSGTSMDMLHQLYKTVPMEMGVDDLVVYVAPKGVPRAQQGAQIPRISAATGMKESPIFGRHGLRVDTLFNSGVVYNGQIFVQSTVVQVANGYWQVTGLHHQLEGNKPSGQWITHITAKPLDKQGGV